MKKEGFTTRILHSDRRGKPEHGSLHKPIHTSVAFGYEKAEDLAAVFQNKTPGYAYGRQANPTAKALEQRITLMENGVGSVCFSSGMSAIGITLMALLKKGDHVVASSFVFGNTASQFNTLANIGIDISWVDATDASKVEAAIQKNTRLVFVETIANPVTQIADLKKIGNVCREKNLIYMVDNTMTTPRLFQPKSVGASLIAHSLTKYIGGHGNALGGSITDTGIYDWEQFPNIFEAYKSADPKQWALMQIRKKGLRDFGACISPESAHILSMGSETLALRVNRASENASILAGFLESHKEIARVNYPGLEAHPQHHLASGLFDKPGALLSFELKDKDCFQVLNKLELVINSSNLGDNRTLAIPVAHTIFYEIGAAKRKEMGIADSLVRVSVGIEDSGDLLNEFEQALR